MTDGRTDKLTRIIPDFFSLKSGKKVKDIENFVFVSDFPEMPLFSTDLRNKKFCQHLVTKNDVIQEKEK